MLLNFAKSPLSDMRCQWQQQYKHQRQQHQHKQQQRKYCDYQNAFKFLMCTIVMLTLCPFTMQAPMYEGDDCVMASRPGVCQLGSKCDTLKEGFKQGIFKTKDVVQCGLAVYESIVCCPLTLDMPTMPISTVKTTTVRTIPKTTTTTTTTTTEKDFWADLLTSTPTTPTTATLSTTTTNKPDFWLDLLSTTTTTTTTAQPDFWLDLISTTTTTTTPKPLVIHGNELNSDAEFFDFSKFIGGAAKKKKPNGPVNTNEILNPHRRNDVIPNGRPAETSASNNLENPNSINGATIFQPHEDPNNNLDNPTISQDLIMPSGRPNPGFNNNPKWSNQAADQSIKWPTDMNPNGNEILNANKQNDLNSERRPAEGTNNENNPNSVNGVIFQTNQDFINNNNKEDPDLSNDASSQSFNRPNEVDFNGRPNPSFNNNPNWFNQAVGQSTNWPNNLNANARRNQGFDNNNGRGSRRRDQVLNNNQNGNWNNQGQSRNVMWPIDREGRHRGFNNNNPNWGNPMSPMRLPPQNMQWPIWGIDGSANSRPQQGFNNNNMGNSGGFNQNFINDNNRKPSWSNIDQGFDRNNNPRNSNQDFTNGNAETVREHEEFWNNVDADTNGRPNVNLDQSQNLPNHPIWGNSNQHSDIQQQQHIIDPIAQVNNNLQNMGIEIVKAVSENVQNVRTTTTTTTVRPNRITTIFNPFPQFGFHEQKFGNEINNEPGPNWSNPKLPTIEETNNDGNNDGANNGLIEQSPKPSIEPAIDPAVPRIKERPAVEACRKIDAGLTASISQHILGGTPAELGEYPHMAAIGYSRIGNDAGPYDFRCGGTLIDSRFVLTAAHCVNDRNGQPSIVRMGVTNFTDPEQMRDVVEIAIKTTHIHPDYKSSRKYNDIAILELEREAKLNVKVYPTCLYMEPEDPPARLPVYVTGWGTVNTATRQFSDILLKAKLELITIDRCNDSYIEVGLNRQLIDGIQQTQMCAYDPGFEKDACQGDSGGPLNVVIDESKYQYRVAGIVSAGFSCGTETPGFYTRVSAYIDYIENIVWPPTAS